ncbi:uncharacterized protein LOC100828066 isoform X2 [Brachypodium distachyon]|uniref:PHD-type domain-containing protein n=1 Tax=Brachypodium distachyon TaxID=15368 RepID=I1GZW7_BRADI|nr:uncharacterized protein LOC100828066 isoform X2 [Brachypodium distachyon]PNT76231.1 hypothetical protein BRADI_1g46180v3 [Brachypodium distachyon]|eukprot:XP_003564114.2 uncharacterized protein LOC100828066 isoform X2 [Brachypodium distachyon]
MEAYFREFTLDDFQALEPKPLFGPNWLDPCLLLPFVVGGKKLGEYSDPSDVAVIAENSDSNLILGKENEEMQNKNDMVHSNLDTQEGSCSVGCNVEVVNNNGINEGHCEQDMQEVILQQEEQPGEIELDQGKGHAVVLPGCKPNLDGSLNWLLGAKDRFVLTSERPNKKRKLLGADAGLDRLVLLPSLEGEAGSRCDVCSLGESDTASNRLLKCNSCEVSVHQKCYGVQVVPDGYWMCAWCNSSWLARRLTRSDAGTTVFMPCVLCPKDKGALKPVKWEPGRTADGGNINFAHLFCSLWAPEVLVEDMDSMEPITNVGDIQENRTKMVCGVCKIMHGACLRCSHGTCRACFHPICAREAKHHMEIWGKSGHTNVEMRAFCAKHSAARSINSLHNVNGVAEHDTPQVGLADENLTSDEKQQMRFTRKSKEKLLNDTFVSSSLSSLNKVQTTEVVSSQVRSVESQQIQHSDMVVDRTTRDEKLVSNSGDVSTVLRKLIDQGKVSVGDIESELGLSSESLEAALVPETTTTSPGLKLKIIKLLQNSVHVPSVQVKSLKEGSMTPQGTLPRIESKNLTDSQLGSELEEGISSFDYCFPEGYKAKDSADSVENCSQNCPDFDDDHISGQCIFNIDGYRCYIHPSVEKKLRSLRDQIKNKKDQAVYYDVEGLLCPRRGADLGGSSMKLEQLTDIAAADQASKAESSGILEYSPHDEIEGEIVYLQSRLLDDVVAMNRRYDDIRFKVVQNLSHELDSFNKRKWDHIIVNQFLRDIREAKKRGNTERRHKEAQAILAAAAPYVAHNPRNVTVIKEAENDVAPAKQEIIPKVNAGSLRVSQLASLPQTKDPSFSNSKVSADTNFGFFDLAKFSKKNGLPCDVCMRSETVLNRIFLCSSCKAAVHLDCYRSRTNPTGPWKCELCEETLSDAVISGMQSDCSGAKSFLVQCCLCDGTSGAFRKTTKGKWVHAFCAEWLLENTFKRGQYNAVGGTESLLKGKDTCSICHHSVGTCLKCGTVGCQVAFHPACARDAGLYMNTKKVGSLWRHKAYCGNHSIEQRKVDSQQYGPAEVKIMKQMRVELERLRLICERIVKREKEKKEVVVCEHDILAARRDHIALSTRSLYYTSGPGGASSESATTSVNNNSYSGKRQRSDEENVTVRSDDVTVDSTITRKHTVRFSVHSRETDRNTADSSTSTISYKRKLDDGESLADKDLQEGGAIASEKSEGETKSVDKKHEETFQKELVKTSDQDMTQKQHPPKRLVYTRRSSSKKKERIQDVQVPGGG